MSRATMEREQAEAQSREEHWALVADRNRLRDEVDALVNLNSARDITILNLRALLERAEEIIDALGDGCSLDGEMVGAWVVDIRKELGK